MKIINSTNPRKKKNTLTVARLNSFHPAESECASVVGAFVRLMIGLHNGMMLPKTKFLPSVPLLQISHWRLVNTLVGFLGNKTFLLSQDASKQNSWQRAIISALSINFFDLFQVTNLMHTSFIL